MLFDGSHHPNLHHKNKQTDHCFRSVSEVHAFCHVFLVAILTCWTIFSPLPVTTHSDGTYPADFPRNLLFVWALPGLPSLMTPEGSYHLLFCSWVCLKMLGKPCYVMWCLIMIFPRERGSCQEKSRCFSATGFWWTPQKELPFSDGEFKLTGVAWPFLTTISMKVS